jgi:hypothetical protein
MRSKDMQRIDPEEVKQYLAKKGVSAIHAAGILPNIEHESAFNPAAIGDQGTSGGLFQHHAERFQKLKQSTGEDWQDWRKQIDYALGEKDTQKYLKQDFNTPEDASKWWTINWERPADAAKKAEQRAKSASKYYQESPQEQAPEVLLETPIDGIITDYQTAQGENIQVTLEDLEKELEVVKKSEEKVKESPPRKTLENKQMFFEEVTRRPRQREIDNSMYNPLAEYVLPQLVPPRSIFETNQDS